MKKILFLCFILQHLSAIYSQNYTISGYVCDSVSGEKLIGVTIFETNSKNGTTSNNYGFYSLTVNDVDTININCNLLGYEKYNEKILTGKKTELNILLKPSENLINEITVHGNVKNEGLGIVSLTPKQISQIPALGSEKDALKSLQLMPGIMQGSEGKSGLFVRGGSEDQNLILLDDVPLYYSEHLGGFLSVFNDDALKNIKIMKGNFPARYGGRLSSVLDVRMKDGNMSKTNISGSVGIISSKIAIDGPIIKNKLSYMISARRMMLDILVLPFAKLLINNSLMGYSFYDVNAKINYKFNNKNNFYLSFYNGKDNVKINSDLNKSSMIYENNSEQKWGNYTTAFRWNHIYGSKLFSNLTFSVCKFKYSSFEETIIILDSLKTSNSNSFYSGIYDINTRLDYEYYVGKNITLNFGVNGIYHSFKPATIKYFQQEKNVIKADTIFSNSKLNSIETSAYFESNIKLLNFLYTNLGIRTNYYKIEDTEFISYEPRADLNAIVNKDISINCSYSYVEQNLHLLSFSGMGVYSDLWVPATKNAIPEKSWQTSFGFDIAFLDNMYNFQVEAYYKKLWNLIDFCYGTFWNNADNWEDNSVKNGKGTCYGLEFLVSRNFGKFNGWISYTYSKSTRQFQNINSGKIFDYDYDRPHDLKISGVYQLKEYIYISANWIFQSGQPINLPIGSMPIVSYDELLENDILLVDNNFQFSFFYDKNSIRIKPYHRLDLAVNLSKQKKHGTRTWSFSIYNVYNRQNAYNYFYDYEYNFTEQKYIRKLYQRTLFPIIPSISYSFKF